MKLRIIRGVRVATKQGIAPASVYLEGGKIVAIAGYQDVGREDRAEELGKSLLIPGLLLTAKAASTDACATALLGGITSLIDHPDRTHKDVADEDSELSQFLPREWTIRRSQDETLEMLIERRCTLAAKRLGLGESKGRIAEGFDADLVIWNPEVAISGTAPLLYGLVRQVIVAGETRVLEGKPMFGATFS